MSFPFQCVFSFHNHYTGSELIVLLIFSNLHQLYGIYPDFLILQCKEYILMEKVAVLIPCYNEAKTIEKVITDFREALPNASIYVYDNNSDDETAGIAEKAGAVVRHEYKRGKGNVVRRIFDDIEAECYIIVDGDDTYPAAAAPEMVKSVMEKRTDMVVGDRLSSTFFQENTRRFHNFGNSFVRFSINRIFKSDMKDIMTGYRAFSYRFVKTFPVLSRGFEIETEMTIHAISTNMSIENVIVEYRDRPEGSESKLNTFSDGFRVLKTILNLCKNYKPFQFFSFLAILLLVIDIAVFIPSVWIPYHETGLVEKYPTLIVCGFVAIAALLAFFNGMVLDSLMQKERREFEFRLIQAGKMKRDSK